MTFSALNIVWDNAITAQIVVATLPTIEISLHLVDNTPALIASHHESSYYISTLHWVSHFTVYIVL